MTLADFYFLMELTNYGWAYALTEWNWAIKEGLVK